jgi:hypothetical protein
VASGGRSRDVPPPALAPRRDPVAHPCGARCRRPQLHARQFSPLGPALSTRHRLHSPATCALSLRRLARGRVFFQNTQTRAERRRWPQLAIAGDRWPAGHGTGLRARSPVVPLVCRLRCPLAGRLDLLFLFASGGWLCAGRSFRTTMRSEMIPCLRRQVSVRPCLPTCVLARPPGAARHRGAWLCQANTESFSIIPCSFSCGGRNSVIFLHSGSDVFICAVGIAELAELGRL